MSIFPSPHLAKDGATPAIPLTTPLQSSAMGKGDRRTKRGKIFQGTTGKRRPKRRKK